MGRYAVSDTGDEEVMKQVDMPILDDAVCIGHWDDFLPETEICAGHENGGKDFCVVNIICLECISSHPHPCPLLTVPRRSILSQRYSLYLCTNMYMYVYYVFVVFQCGCLLCIVLRS